MTSNNSSIPLKADIPEIKRALAVLFQPEDVVELRALEVEGKVHAGYLNDFEKLAQAAALLNGRATGVYVVLNHINPDLIARSQNRITIKPKNLTQDADITRRRWLPIDVDTKRPAGISSTVLEHEAALGTTKTIKSYLIEQGFPIDSILTGDSGNGGHILIRIDFPNDAESLSLIKAVLKALAVKFDSDKVSIDQSVSNAARIWKLYGTLARKGDNTTDRPHRIARLLDVPASMVIAPLAAVQDLAAMAGPGAPKQSNRPYQGNGQPFDFESWIARNNIEILRAEPYQGGKRYILRSCAFNPSHNGTSAAIIQLASGALVYKCQHDECSTRTWADLRELKEPGYRDNDANNVSYYTSSNSDHLATNNYGIITKTITKGASQGSAITTEVIEDWVQKTAGWFSTDELDKELGIVSSDDKNIRRVALHRLNKEKGVIEHHQTQNKLYRRIDKDARKIDFKHAGNREPLALSFPFDIHKLASVFPKNIIIVAGASDAGKTGFLLNFIRLNQEAFPIYYFSSEMGEQEIANRLANFEGIELEDWNFTAEERSSNWADVIRPDCVNIIDFMEISADFSNIAEWIRQVYDKLGSGIAIIAIQKNPGVDLGRGGTFSLEKARLYLSMDPGVTTITKAKNWVNPAVNPNRLKIKYKIVKGCRFILEPEGWVNGEGQSVIIPVQGFKQLEAVNF